ncbi:hypothetical protein COCC4DRAFT_195066 [Bipolaris maydis ATCC 48331]|uniref:Transposase IS30-like HTH domain-containing protein n=1 Tax=Cochliobolus heterostrophus (strain C4 / ATCC 48331 / race T) TaxID=665024 RepID=N4WXM3_COCH4|nr:uncharacterized protein COCC4DRAFT_195066 [Bipolaris maydis ATCC 48331]KAJ5028527.1 hypothetical protein J3E73DRAFT_33467 [Bipolaris maydis]ENI05379.1 hypothetical protein COCC4DRAFT_195066 [Bipolaris maydis ATCC 48331]KAJ6199572.1 hypothetical protein J3E72DRAFT_33299 [Bipolaris maydis]KAJ6205826.1 hypothetical protein PSV09DRAFT_2011942 [Bipolaris maydis]KAJ6272699.1 hypothetical protein PSV08DRAFT_33409 [Bipolaris maydis]
MDEPAIEARQPKRKQLSRDQRLQIHTLRQARFTYKQIATQLNVTYRSVQYALSVPVTPQKRSGRPPALSPKQITELITFIRSSKETR